MTGAWIRASLASVLLASLVTMAGCSKGERTPLGAFDIYTQGARYSGSTARVSLYYKRRLLTDRYGAAVLDPANPSRIAFSGDTEFNSAKDPCGTFVFDAATGRQDRVAAWPDGLGSWTWSPDGHKLLLGGNTGVYPEVTDVDTRESVPLASTLSRKGEQLEMHALGWSPDSQRVAVVIHLSRAGDKDGVQDWDLVEITLDPLAAQYVATMHAQTAVWEPSEYRWQDSRLIAVGTGRRYPIMQKADGDLGWTTTPPDSLKRSPSTPCM